jgi:hypothetical protein
MSKKKATGTEFDTEHEYSAKQLEQIRQDMVEYSLRLGLRQEKAEYIGEIAIEAITRPIE